MAKQTIAHETTEQKMARTSVEMRMEVRSLDDNCIRAGAEAAAYLVGSGKVSHEKAVGVGVRVAKWRWYKLIGSLIVLAVLALLWFSMSHTASAETGMVPRAYIPAVSQSQKRAEPTVPMSAMTATPPTATPQPEIGTPPVVTPEAAQ